MSLSDMPDMALSAKAGHNNHMRWLTLAPRHILLQARPASWVNIPKPIPNVIPNKYSETI